MMDAVVVVGGTYREQAAEPVLNRVFGSGLRAAGMLRSLGHRVKFHTRIDASSFGEAAVVAAGLDVDLLSQPRATPVTFQYETPLSPAVQLGAPAEPPLHVEAQTVVGFGMVECSWSAAADYLVVDPQHSCVEDLLAGCTASHIALVLNEHEAGAQTGRTTARKAALDLLGEQVDVVVVKQGALGGLVVTPDDAYTYGAVPTETVHPLGSGDAFTAGFASRWIASPRDPLAAAQHGSAVAACHSLTSIPQVDQRLLDDLPDALPYLGDAPPTVYLAGPFFSVAERTLIRMTRRALRQIGVRVFSPLDDVGLGGDEVALRDLEGLRSAHAVLALLDGADPGTLFEVGWATRAEIPVVGFAEYPDDHAWTMLRGTSTRVSADLSTAVYGAGWAAIDRAGSAR